MSGISAHMIVKNEDQWVLYALRSILPYVDEVLVADTGSTDHTLELIRSINSPKIKLTQHHVTLAKELTKIRSLQLQSSKYPWVWIIDADEIYPEKTAKECLAATDNNDLEGILVRRYDLLGDIYHRQIESVGQYDLFGHKGHLLIRLVNLAKLKNLSYAGDYPNEGFFDQSHHSILTHDPSLWQTTDNYLYHAMYLKRSSLGANLSMFNRGKYKIEKGINLGDEPPSVFMTPRPSLVSDPLSHRGMAYELTASLITPIKKIKRLIS